MTSLSSYSQTRSKITKDDCLVPCITLRNALVMNEEIVQERVLETLSAPEEHDRILKRMMRYRDPTGVYADGGCIDSTRDSLRWVHPETTNIQICTTYN